MTAEQWNAIKNNDKSYDGSFFYALKTTGVVCRPSCTARACNAKNVIIFDTLESAVNAGFRTCSRCRPELPGWTGAANELTESAKKYIEKNYLEKFSLDRIAGALYINKYYLSRAFKKNTGHTLLWYHNYIRCEEAVRMLERAEHSMAYISDSVGFMNESHFARVFKTYYGISPTEYRKRYFESFIR